MALSRPVVRGAPNWMEQCHGLMGTSIVSCRVWDSVQAKFHFPSPVESPRTDLAGTPVTPLEGVVHSSTTGRPPHSRRPEELRHTGGGTAVEEGVGRLGKILPTQGQCREAALP